VEVAGNPTDWAFDEEGNLAGGFQRAMDSAAVAH
jgi:hypothetical protein